jgi:thioredoxin reductase
MGAGAVQKMMHVHRVLPGKNILVVGSGNVGLILAYQLAQAGAQVAGVVEALPCVTGYQVHAGKIRRLGIPLLTGHTIVRALGKDRVEGAVVAPVENGNVDCDSSMELACDLICLAVGMRPFDEIIRAAYIDVRYVHALGGFVPLHNEDMETTRENVFVAGDITGIEEANTAMDEGRLVGTVVARRTGKLSSEEADVITGKIRKRLQDLRIGSYGDMRTEGKRAILTLYEEGV